MTATDEDTDTIMYGRVPLTDPTKLTDAAIAKLKAQMEQYIEGQMGIRDERLAAIDIATNLRLQTMDGMPDLINEKILSHAMVDEQRFEGIAIQLRDRDTLSQRESALNALALAAAFNASKEAVAAALTAQKEAAAKQDEANAKAIDKSEKATAETIKTNQELSSNRLDGLTKGLDEVKLTVNGIQNTKVGATENKAGMYAFLAAAGLIILVVIGMLTFAIANLPN